MLRYPSQLEIAQLAEPSPLAVACTRAMVAAARRVYSAQRALRSAMANHGPSETVQAHRLNVRVQLLRLYAIPRLATGFHSRSARDLGRKAIAAADNS